jgi:hypothetical protein
MDTTHHQSTILFSIGVLICPLVLGMDIVPKVIQDFYVIIASLDISSGYTPKYN